jgi:lipoate-protein ligase A
VEGAKICGSAQRRRQGAVLQHGSLLLRRSPAAPELAGLRDVTDLAFTESELIEAWHMELAARLRLDLTPSALSPLELDQAKTLVAGKYDCAKWTERR